MITTINEFRNTMKLAYVGQCDVLRKRSAYNDMLWHQMMRKRKKISFAKFFKTVDISALLDKDETFAEFIEPMIGSDKSTAAYSSTWGEKPAMFLQSMGFEYIFFN